MSSKLLTNKRLLLLLFKRYSAPLFCIQIIIERFFDFLINHTRKCFEEDQSLE